MTTGITVAPRYTRAVNVERDLNIPAAVEGYILTATVESVLTRFIATFGGPAGHRAWTVTGPYGTGKSAFAVFLANLLGSPSKSGSKLARDLVADVCPELGAQLFDRRKRTAIAPDGYCPVVLSGRDEPLSYSVIRALSRDIPQYWSLRQAPPCLKRIGAVDAKIRAGAAISTDEVVEAVTSTVESMQRSGRSQGVLLIVDELGRFLEFAARQPERGDVHILQSLAELTAAVPSNGLLMFTTLHQSFDRYVAGLQTSTRNEWAKVQGRFEDIAFHESPEEFLLLLSQAIRQGEGPEVKDLRRKAGDLADQAFELKLGPRGMTKQQFRSAMQDCAPLHPLSVLILATLCRKFGQHQRSLFSFLVSREPNGFCGFVERDSLGELYSPDRLYEFMAASFGSALSIGESGTRWAEAQTALDRCSDASAVEQRVIKVVGLLAASGTHGNLKPSREIVELACGQEGKSAIKALLSKSVLVYRKYSASLALWEGSDIDLDSRLQDAEVACPATNLVQKLTTSAAQRAVVAKRHSVETGTLRFFAVRYADVSTLNLALQRDKESDGILVYAVPANDAEAEELMALATSARLQEREDVLVAVCKHTDSLHQAVRDLELLRWVRANTPEIHGDRVASREVRARMTAAKRRVDSELAMLFSPTSVATGRAVWFYRGMVRPVEDSKSLSTILSDICDAVYPNGPRLRNELLNRRTLSSAAAAARNELIGAMVTRGAEANLGITGTPPEMSMYASLLLATGIHRREESGYTFGPPTPESGLLGVWHAIEHFFERCELEKRSVAELWTTLQEPPYGMKLGPIPVLFCAAMQAHDTEIALYENGRFTPDVGPEHFERLVHGPEMFHVRRYRVEGVRRDVYNQFALLLGTSEGEQQTLVAVVKQLYRFFNRLPKYTKNTATLSEIASAVREAFMSSRDPGDLLFKELPVACGFTPFLPGTSGRKADATRFSATLKGALIELQRRYDDLLAETQQLLFSAVGLTGAKSREILRYRAQAAMAGAIEPRLRAFLHHLCDEELDDSMWIEAIAALLTTKPAKAWTDADRAHFEVALSELARSFRHVESLSTALTRRASHERVPAEVIRVGVTDRSSRDHEAVVVVEPEHADSVRRAAQDIQEQLRNLNLPGTGSLAVLAIASRVFLEELDQGATNKARVAEITS